MSITARMALSLVFAFTLAGGPALRASVDAAQNARQSSGGPPGAAPQRTSPTPVGMDKPATYVGDEACKACHKNAADTFSETLMGKIFIKNARDERERHGCETCHGPGSLYIKDMAAAMGTGIKPGPWHGPSKDGLIAFRKDSGESPRTDNAVCLTCHNRGEQAFWRAGTHAFRGLRCTDCHTIMRKLSPEFQLGAGMQSNPFIITRPETQVCLRCHLKQKVQINMPSHMPIREGLMTCTDCHNPHGGPYPKMLKQATANETCYFCHAAKRGPWLWMHPPVAQDCLNCHDPHGSINRFMLTVRPPRLCQQCHVAEHAGSPYSPRAYYAFSRACLNCHFHIHGSNSPGGWALTR